MPATADIDFWVRSNLRSAGAAYRPKIVGAQEPRVDPIEGHQAGATLSAVGFCLVRLLSTNMLTISMPLFAETTPKPRSAAAIKPRGIGGRS